MAKDSIHIDVDNKALLANLHKFRRSVQTSVIGGIIRKNVKPLVTEMKTQAPDRRLNSKGEINKVKYKNKRYDKEYEPGNLKKSISTKTFTRGGNTGDVSVYVGPNKGTKYDGWYAMFQELGTKTTGFGKGIKPNPFIKRSADNTVPTIKGNLANDTTDYVVEVAKKLGFDATSR